MTPHFTPALHLFIGLGLVWLGAVVGSFANVCVYRLPWGKSVIWPDSHCPNCLTALKKRDNLPIFGWLLLRAECRNCGVRISPRYVLMELALGLLFLLVHVATCADLGWRCNIDEIYIGRLVLGTVLITFLLIATMMDYDWMIITDSVTYPGMAAGLLLGTLLPMGRPLPMFATSNVSGLLVGLGGIAAGFGIILFFRFFGSIIFRREAMGLGDATLMGVVGAFVGWRATILAFFLAPFFGLAHALWKLVRLGVLKLQGRQSTQLDHEMPFGPYLSMASAFTILSWPWLWKYWAKEIFTAFYVVFIEMV
jgi:leader peptidase (prepilin peptidase)/N-methyltransferase